MRLFIDINLTNAASIVVERVTIKTGERPNLLLPELLEVLLASVLNNVGGMGWSTVLLEDVIATSGDLVDLQLHHIL